MRCASCGRGLTWRRVERDSALDVYRAGVGSFVYCGRCFYDDKADIQEGDELIILLGSESNYYGRRVVRAVST